MCPAFGVLILLAIVVEIHFRVERLNVLKFAFGYSWGIVVHILTGDYGILILLSLGFNNGYYLLQQLGNMVLDLATYRLTTPF